MIKRYMNWKGESDLSIYDYISNNIHPEDLLVFYDLLLPTLVERFDCIFFEDKYNQSTFERWNTELKGDKVAIEKVLNHVHVYDIFGNCQDEIEDVVYEKIAFLLQKIWKYHFKDSYPEKNIVVELIINESEYGPTLYVYQNNMI